MSGHSKWAKIKRKKGANDAKKGAIFTKIARAITLAASEGGGDLDMNFSLRLAVDKGKAENMPSENIERAIKKGTGEGSNTVISRVTYEVIGPSSVSIIIDCATDNTNRTVSTIKNTVEQHGGKMAGQGSLSWRFSEKGLIIIKPAKTKKSEKFGAENEVENLDIDKVIDELMEIDGIEDLEKSTHIDSEENEFEVVEIVTSKNDFAKADKDIRAKGFVVVSSELIKTSSDKKSLSEKEQEKVLEFLEMIEEIDDVDSVWTDLE